MTSAGFTTVPFETAADIYVVNTCSVTDNADRKCRYTIRKALDLNPEAFIVIVGCYAQLKPKEIADIEGVDLVLGAAEKFNLVEHLKSLEKKTTGEFIASDVCDANVFVNAWSMGERTRTFLKVQDGCDYNCSFCTIPLARGNSRSNTIANAVKDAKEIAENGIKEIVLTGVNIGDFGKGKNGARRANESFLDLIKELDRIQGIERFRISSIEPNLLSNEIIEFVAQSERFMPHFHVPLQSGNNELLAKMRRRYLRELYADRVSIIKKLMPHACIGVDVIVGFPGETEAHFLDTYNFINELDVSYLHVFTYSERDNTLAIEMDSVVPVNERRKRNKMLRILSDKKKRYFYNLHLKTQRPVLWEDNEQNGLMQGFTDNYVKVKAAYNKQSANNIENFELSTIESDLLVTGTVAESLVTLNV
ncbi:UNVERIFIED_CONTAM: hypothetical protein GTU68_001674 [Idotea baltica]|nr:hypothetical protein [Idotea baltica]